MSGTAYAPPWSYNKGLTLFLTPDMFKNVL